MNCPYCGDDITENEFAIDPGPIGHYNVGFECLKCKIEVYPQYIRDLRISDEDIDITEFVYMECVNNKTISLLECVCGAKFVKNELRLSADKKKYQVCPACERKLYYSNDVRIWEIDE